MPGFASYDELINKITAAAQATDFHFHKASSALQGAGWWHSLWKATGTPAAGSDPAATPGTQYNASSAGALSFSNVSPMTRHGLSFGAVASQNLTLMVYDRLVGVSGISLATTGVKTVNSTALPRYTDGVGVQPWLEVTTATTTTAPNVNLNSYTNDSGVAGRSGTGLTFPAAATVLTAAIGPLPPQAGDKGVRSVESLNVATAAAAGVVNLILIKPLEYIPLTQSIWNERDLVMQFSKLPRIYDDACLGLMLFASGTTSSQAWGQIKTGYN